MKRNGFLTKVVSVLALSSILLVGCSSSEEEGEGINANSKITLNVFQGKVEFKDQFESLANKYEEEYPGVDINITTVGGGSDYLTSLKSKFATGDEPEIFSIAGPSEAAQFQDYLADLSDSTAASLALEGSLTAMSDGEKVYGLPFNQEGYGFIYNKEIFKKAGVNPEEILTYEDLETAVKTIDSKKEELGIDGVFALAAYEKWVIGSHLSNVFLAPEFNHDVLEAYNSNTVNFDKSNELKRMLDLQNKYSVQPTLTLDYSQQVEQYFSLQKVAMIQQGNWAYPSVYETDPEFAENNIGILPIPVEGFEGSLPVGIPNYWSVNGNKDEEVIQASKDFLDWIYTSEVGKEAVLKDFKFIPAYEGYDTSQISDPLSKEIYEYASEGKIIGWVFLGYPTGPWGDVLGGNMQQYLDGQMLWEEVITESRSEWERSRQ